jgi:hypothetical protein
MKYEYSTAHLAKYSDDIVIKQSTPSCGAAADSELRHTENL